MYVVRVVNGRLSWKKGLRLQILFIILAVKIFLKAGQNGLRLTNIVPIPRLVETQMVFRTALGAAFSSYIMFPENVCKRARELLTHAEYSARRPLVLLLRLLYLHSVIV